MYKPKHCLHLPVKAFPSNNLTSQSTAFSSLWHFKRSLLIPHTVRETQKSFKNQYFDFDIKLFFDFDIKLPISWVFDYGYIADSYRFLEMCY